MNHGWFSSTCRIVFSIAWLSLAGVVYSDESTAGTPIQSDGNRDEVKSVDAIPENSIVGCLTSGCHGATDPQLPLWQRAGRIWFDEDPHAQAYTKLIVDPRSLTIAEKLLHRSFSSSDDQTYREFLDRRCVSCHASPHVDASRLVMGVACQACHGPVAAWGGDHYSEETRAKGALRFEGTDRVNLEDPMQRAQTCCGCHVGDLQSSAGEREVNHDLMAAGHPPMYFEIETFLRFYPKHWSITPLPNAAAASPLTNWQVGQFVYARTRLKLLMDRMERFEQGNEAIAWPELTEFSCYSCHHDLTQPSWRQDRSARSTMDWDGWCLSGLRQASPASARALLDKQIASLQKATTRSDASPSQIRQAAHEIVQFVDMQLNEVKNNVTPTRQAIADGLRELAQNPPDRLSWESGSQWWSEAVVRMESLDPSHQENMRSDLPLSQRLQHAFLDGPEGFNPERLSLRRSEIEQFLRKIAP